MVGLAGVFTGVALRQAVVLHRGDLPALVPALDAALLGEAALLGVALAGLGALRALQRTTRERDRAEDLHWDSMEAVRVMSELAARPGAGLEEKLATMLELGAARFGLELGVAWQQDDTGGRVLGARAPTLAPERRDDLLAALTPHLRDASRAARPLLRLDDREAPHTLLAVSIAAGGATWGSLAFVGLRNVGNRFTATDKDLLGLMAQWLATEIERRERAAAIAALAEAPVSFGDVARSVFRPRRGHDLNHVVGRLERRLRQRVGADGTLTLDLGDVPPVQRGQLSLPRLVESLVDAAARLAPTGRMHVATEPPEDDGAFVVLRIRVEAPEIAGDALARLFAESQDAEAVPHGTLPLPRIERLLRVDGGDLSVAVEPERGATLTAWLPTPATRATTDDARPDQAAPSPSR
ncbi:MAG: GAF domain-containing protein [Myxococcota bacterium]